MMKASDFKAYTCKGVPIRYTTNRNPKFPNHDLNLAEELAALILNSAGGRGETDLDDGCPKEID